jgi:UDP-N-acetylglucosamine acyltransferase
MQPIMIHETAIIEKGAELDDSVEIGAYAIISKATRIGAGCKISAHAQLCGKVELGPGNHIGRAAIIGGDPQDLTFDTTLESGVRIGSGNDLREHVTIHRSASGGGWTSIGNDNFLMTGSHVGHDVIIGHQNVIANNCLLAGHVSIDNHTFLGGGSGFHQFIHIGELSMTQGNSSISKDIPPYCIASQLNRLVGLNVVGLRRAGMDAETRAEIKRAYRATFRSRLPLAQALEEIQDEPWGSPARHFLRALANPGRKGVCFHRPGRDGL